MRRTIISGRIANFGRYYKPAEDDKSAFAVAFVNVSMDRKDEETGYTATLSFLGGSISETKPMKVIANAWLADRLNNFEANDTIYLEGKLEVESDYTNSEGELVKGGWIVRVDFIDNWGSKTSATATPPAKGATKATHAAPTKGAKPKVGTGIKMPTRAKKSQA